jgi:uncharacterized protein (DUF1501 family)
VSKLTRRKFIAVSGLGTAGAITALGSRFAFAAPGSPETGDTIVAIFLRGGADGLSIAAPYDYPSYRQIRPNIALPPPGDNLGALPLDAASSPDAVFLTGIDGVLGLNPGLQPIYETLWAQGKLAVLPATGLPASESATRSHFEAETFVGRGSASPAVGGGWLGRMLNVMNPQSVIGGVNMANNINLLQGAQSASAVNDLRSFGINGFRDRERATTALAALNSGSDSISLEGQQVLATVERLQELNGANNSQGYPNSGIGQNLAQVSTLLKAELGLQAAAIDIGGWDTHGGQGNGDDSNGQFYQKMEELGTALRVFADDTNQLEEVTVIVLTEFGRTINENGNGGTDHGRAATYLAMGAGIQGGVFGDDYPDTITDGPRGDLEVLTDYRKPMAEIVMKRAGLASVEAVFPTYEGEGELGLAVPSA